VAIAPSPMLKNIADAYAICRSTSAKWLWARFRLLGWLSGISIQAV
jgi:hypothetical protein